MDENFSKIVTIRGPSVAPASRSAPRDHQHAVIHRVDGATVPIPGGIFKRVKHATEWCACGAHRMADELTDAGGFVSFGTTFWTEPLRFSL